jgi:hypothetical protein
VEQVGLIYRLAFVIQYLTAYIWSVHKCGVEIISSKISFLAIPYFLLFLLTTLPVVKILYRRRRMKKKCDDRILKVFPILKYVVHVFGTVF